jgi:hypothetical protein
MAKLNKGESASLMAIMDKPCWSALTKLVAMTINELNAREIPGQNEFETLRALHIRQGRTEGLKEFFNDLENGVSLSEEANRGQLD